MAQETDFGHDPALGGSLSFLLQGVTIVGSLFFVTGWRYAHAYYGGFGIGLSQLEIPTPYFFVLIQPLVFEAPFALLLPPILLFFLPWVVLIIFQFMKKFPKKKTSRRPPSWIVKLASINMGYWSFFVLLVFLLVWPFQASKIGYAHAQRDINPETTHLPVVSMKMKTPEGENDQFLTRLRGDGISDGEYLFLGRHRNTYLLVPIKRLQGIRGFDVARILMLPDAIIASIAIQEESS